MPHAGKRIFITGISTGGKSFLARKIAAATGGNAIELDEERKILSGNPQYRKWINFYLDKNEEKYLAETSPDEQWRDFVAQAEGLWPAYQNAIAAYADEKKPIIFESVSLLPHLTKRDVTFPGIVLLGKSYEETLARNKKSPRWGGTERLQELEAKKIFFIERPRYAAEAKQFDYPVFTDAKSAFTEALKLLR